MDARDISSLIFRNKIVLTDTFTHVKSNYRLMLFWESQSQVTTTKTYSWRISIKTLTSQLCDWKATQWNAAATWDKCFGQTRFAVCKIKYVIFLPVWLGSYFKHLESLSSYCFYFDRFNSVFLLFSVGIYFCCCSKMCFPFTYVTKSNRI